MVPETERLEPILLVGETPDPTRIPFRLPVPDPLSCASGRYGRRRGCGETAEASHYPCFVAEANADFHSSACHLVAADTEP